MTDKSAFQVFTRPNFFEIFLKEHLEESLKPAFKIFVAWLSRRDSRYRWISKHKTAIFHMMMTMIEGYHLWKFDSTFSERFLDLQRVSSSSSSSVISSTTTTTTTTMKKMMEIGKGMTFNQKIGSLAMVVGVPMIFETFARVMKRRGMTEEKHMGAKFERAVANVMPMLKTMIGVVSVGYSIAFIGNMTSFSSPWLHIVGVKLVSSSSSSSSATTTATTIKTGGGMISMIGKVIGDTMRLVLPIAAFGYRSLEWWYSMPQTVSGIATMDEIPPTPEPPKMISGVTVPKGYLCPLCGKTRTNTAVLASSGFAFCYPCITLFVREHEKCPVTGLPSNETQIHRLFDH